MKLFFHYSALGYSNLYILGGRAREAVLIDPSHMAKGILNFIEHNGYHLRAILVTHDHKNHVQGLKTLKRIYDAEVYAVNHVIMGHKAMLIRDGETIRIDSFAFDVVSIPGHSPDSVVFKIGRILFTGDVLSAGLIGKTASNYGDATELAAMRSKLFSLPYDCMVFPGHGPPTSLESERRFNAGIQLCEEKRRKGFAVPPLALFGEG
jgi:glyoxylase-like metal-dependent hydrolase (beta-lactamase superfamily II)